jgi:hypothetical protein
MTTPSTTDTPPRVDPSQIVFQLATGYVLSAALQTAVRLGIADSKRSSSREARPIS